MKYYTTIFKNLRFGEAFDYINKVSKNNIIKYGIRLPAWKEDVVVRIQYPDKNSKMTAPYLYVESRFGRVPWKETMIELFSEEWQIVKIVDEEDNKDNMVANDKCSPECSKRCLKECDKYKSTVTEENLTDIILKLLYSA